MNKPDNTADLFIYAAYYRYVSEYADYKDFLPAYNESMAAMDELNESLACGMDTDTINDLIDIIAQLIDCTPGTAAAWYTHIKRVIPGAQRFEFNGTVNDTEAKYNFYRKEYERLTGALAQLRGEYNAGQHDDPGKRAADE